MEETRIYLSEKEMPRQWYNIQADLPKPLPLPFTRGRRKPLGPQDLAPSFHGPDRAGGQPAAVDRHSRGSVFHLQALEANPLCRAKRLEEALKTPARIYYKNESLSPAGSHKPNTAVAQAYYNKKERVKRLATETGAGQWGSALAFGCNLFDWNAGFTWSR